MERRELRPGRSHNLAVFALLGTVAGLVWAAPAWGHARFIENVGPVEAGSVQELTLNVEAEAEEFEGQVPNPANFFNEKIETQIPEGWEVRSCAPKDTWTCDVGSGQITWSKSPGSGKDPENDTFTFTAKAPPTPGTFFFKTLQTYNSGCGGKCTASWNTESGSENPSPKIEVVAGTNAGTQPSATPSPTDAHGHFSDTSTPAASPSLDDEAATDSGGGSGGGAIVAVVVAAAVITSLLVIRRRRKA